MNARNAALVALVAMLSLLFVFSGVAIAADAVKVTGTVSVTKDDDGNITAVKITAGETAIKVALDENGKKLGAALAGKKAEVTGTYEGEGDAKVLKVEAFKEVKAEE